MEVQEVTMEVQEESLVKELSDFLILVHGQGDS